MSNFRVGQKVVCVNDGNSAALELGTVYTITGVIDWMRPTNLGVHDTGVTLAEVDPSSGHCGFASSRFRPVAERKTDISIFKAMLNPSKQRAVA